MGWWLFLRRWRRPRILESRLQICHWQSPKFLWIEILNRPLNQTPEEGIYWGNPPYRGPGLPNEQLEGPSRRRPVITFISYVQSFRAFIKLNHFSFVTYIQSFYSFIHYHHSCIHYHHSFIHSFTHYNHLIHFLHSFIHPPASSQLSAGEIVNAMSTDVDRVVNLRVDCLF